MSSFWWGSSLAAIIVLGGCCCWGADVKTPPATIAIFGTDNGYDRGGPDPVCWRSHYSSTATTSTNGTTSTPSPDAWNQQLWDSFTGTDNTTTEATNIELLQRCDTGTHLLVQPVVVPASSHDKADEFSAKMILEQATVFTGSSTTFAIELNFSKDTSPFSNTSSNSTQPPQQQPPVAAAFVRLQLCDALRYGFCNPLAQLINNHRNFGDDDDNVQVWAEQEEAKEEQDNVDRTTTLEMDGQTKRKVFLSAWTTVPLRADDDNDDDNGISWHGSTNVSIHFPRASTTRTGPYHVIAHAFVVVRVNQTTNVTTISRWDIAAPIPGHILTVQNPPKLLEVTQVTKIIMGVAIGLCGAFALALVIFCTVRRHHAAMRLAQGNFLTAISIGCFVQIVCSFALFPTKDMYCRFFGVVGLLPMTFVAACMVGRIWRVYRTLAKVHQLGRRPGRRPGPQNQLVSPQPKRRQSLANVTGDSVVSALTSIANLPFVSPNNKREGRDARHRNSRPLGGVRQAITARETTSLVVALTLPQLILQVLAVTLADRELVLDTDVTGSFQRLACGKDGRWATLVGTVYVVIVCMLAVGLAWVSRDLPSAFNEKEQVYRAATVCILATFIGIALWGHLNDPATHPDLAVRPQHFCLFSKLSPFLIKKCIICLFCFRSFCKEAGPCLFP
jgi:7 transmembrane sweet-taste receptor of 3 GCPR